MKELIVMALLVAIGCSVCPPQFVQETAVYEQGLTQEQWQILQSQKEQYGDLPEGELQSAQFSGVIDCRDFTHLRWEHPIPMQFIQYVGVDEFEAWARTESWLQENDENANPCMSIYSFAAQFSIGQDELISLIEDNGLTDLYDVDTVKRRYEYFLAP